MTVLGTRSSPTTGILACHACRMPVHAVLVQMPTRAYRHVSNVVSARMAQSIKLPSSVAMASDPRSCVRGLKVLDVLAPACGLSVETTDYDLGARRWHATGETLPDSVLDELRKHDAILLGAVGDPSVPSGVLERGLLLRLRFELDHYVNLRPCRLYPGMESPLRAPGEIDFVVVREARGPLRRQRRALGSAPHEIARGQPQHRLRVERVVRDAFVRAQPGLATT